MTQHSRFVPTASQTVGPFFSIGLSPRCPNNLLPAGEAGATRAIAVRGRVIDGDGLGVPDAVLEIWRPDQSGVFPGAGDPVVQNADGVPSGFARIPTNDQGEFEFTTIKPGPLKVAGAEVHAPHLTVIIFMRGLLRHLLTRMYFPHESANETDTILTLVTPGRRKTLIAQPVSEAPNDLLWNVRLQGDAETVFFEA